MISAFIAIYSVRLTHGILRSAMNIDKAKVGSRHVPALLRSDFRYPG